MQRHDLEEKVIMDVVEERGPWSQKEVRERPEWGEREHTGDHTMKKGNTFLKATDWENERC